MYVVLLWKGLGELESQTSVHIFIKHHGSPGHIIHRWWGWIFLKQICGTWYVVRTVLSYWVWHGKKQIVIESKSKCIGSIRWGVLLLFFNGRLMTERIPWKMLENN